jgi:uncharacterized protein YsxB (DUF464 family)
MIEITITGDMLSVKGHAKSTYDGFPPTKTETEACAAITALAQGLLYSIINVTNNDISGNYKIDKGDMELNRLDKFDEKGRLLVDAFIVSARFVEDGYPVQIKVIDKRRLAA